MKIFHNSAAVDSRPVTRILLVWALATAILLANCQGADPRPSDVERVKQHFLMLRFNAALSHELRNQSDRELLELSCRAKRVNCRKLLELAAKKDPNFHAKIIQNENKGTYKQESPKESP